MRMPSTDRRTSDRKIVTARFCRLPISRELAVTQFQRRVGQTPRTGGSGSKPFASRSYQPSSSRIRRWLIVPEPVEGLAPGVVVGTGPVR